MKTRMWANAQRDGRLPNIGGALYGSSVIPFLVPRRKVWLTPAAGMPCSNAAPRRKTRYNLQGCPKLSKRSQPMAEVDHIISTCRGGIAV